MLSVNSSFLLNDQGNVGILFDDPNFVRSETILCDRQTGDVHALINETQMLVGHITGKVIDTLMCQSKVMLSSLRCDGSTLDLEARLVVIQ